MDQYPTTPEYERQPERNPFNIDAMTNDEVLDLGRALSIAAEAIHKRELNGNADKDLDAHKFPDSESRSDYRMDDMWEKLQAAARELPARDLTRARELLALEMSSHNEHDLTAAAAWAEGFHDYDYELARDTLIHLYADDDLRGDQFSETAMSRLRSLYDTRLTPEQRADYDTKLGEYDERLRFDHQPPIDS